MYCFKFDLRWGIGPDASMWWAGEGRTRAACASRFDGVDHSKSTFGASSMHISTIRAGLY